MSDMNQSITVTFASGEEVSFRDALIIEQEPWVNTKGQIKKSDFYKFSLGVMVSYVPHLNLDCGLDSDGKCVSTIYVYPKIHNLNFKLYASYGHLSTLEKASYTLEEVLTLDFNLEGSLKYTPDKRGGSVWIGAVYDKDFHILEGEDRPGISFEDDGTFTISKKVHGILKVSYTVERYTCNLTVTARDSGSDLFGAVIYGIYENGISWLEISNPPNVDELSNGSSLCGGLKIDDDDDDEEPDDDYEEPEVSLVKREIKYDYCSLEVKSDTVTYVKYS